MGVKLLENFKHTQGGQKDGFVTRDEFESMMRELSTQVPNDEYFVNFLQTYWKVVEDDDASITNCNVMHIIGLLR